MRLQGGVPAVAAATITVLQPLTVAIKGHLLGKRLCDIVAMFNFVDFVE